MNGNYAKMLAIFQFSVIFPAMKVFTCNTFMRSGLFSTYQMTGCYFQCKGVWLSVLLLFNFYFEETGGMSG